MKQCLGMGASLTAIILGAAPSAQAEEIPLDFGLPIDETASGSPPEIDLARDWTAEIALSFEPSQLQSATSLSEPKPLHIRTFQPAANTPISSGGGMATPRIQIHAAPPPGSTPLPPTELPTQAAQQVGATDLFDGEADSLVARAVGSAEGTRTPEGGYTAAYYGHVDPGNGVWNLGSFSYQHGANSPEEADRKQLKRLKTQAEDLKRQAEHKGLQLSLQEELNGIDLANQAPLAALDRGYIDWLHQARQLNMPEDEGVLWARTRSFLDPDTGTWNAPGLGNHVYSISHDQARRQTAIAHAIAVFKRREEESIQVARAPSLEKMTKPHLTGEEDVDLVLSMDLSEHKSSRLAP